MKKTLFSLCAALVLAGASPGAVVAADSPKPLRHLEYQFTIGMRSDTTTRDSGIKNSDDSKQRGAGVAASGINELRAGSSDEGKILADVVAFEPDGGVVIRISEQTRGTRSAESAQCVVYGTTYVICDTSKKVNDEEYEVLRFLGRGFTAGVHMDSSNHWTYRETSPGSIETSDFRITQSSKDAMALDIDRVLHISGAGAYDVTSHGKLDYDKKLSVPTTLTMLTVTRAELAGGKSNRSETQFEAKLVADSMTH